MTDYSLFGQAVDQLMRRKNLNIEALAVKAGIKRQTLVGAMTGKSKPQRNTRKWVFEVLGVSAENFFELEQRFADEEQGEVSTISPMDFVISEQIGFIAEKIDGLPLFVARSIVREYGIAADLLGVGQVEEILRRKAREYRELKEQIQSLQPSDLRVKKLQENAMRSLDLGDFTLAKEHLAAARKIDHDAWVNFEENAISRKKSELDTIKSQARLFSLSFDYQNAATICKEAIELCKSNLPELIETFSVDLARFLSLSANEKGGNDVIEQAIGEISDVLKPLLPGFSLESKIEIYYRLADIYSVGGYRLARNDHLCFAVRIFRSNVCLARRWNLAKEEISNLIRLGDCHAELGLNRGSGKQIRLGLRLMERALQNNTTWASESDRGRNLIKLGTSLANAALFLSDVEFYEQAEQAYCSAAEIFDGVDEINWGRAQWGLGISKTGIGEHRGELKYFDDAEHALDIALRKITKDRFPIDHSTIIQNRGNVRMMRGLLENTTDSLVAAILDYDEALKTRTDDRFKLGKIKTIGNRSKAKGVLASRTGDTALAVKAAQELEAELTNVSEGYWKTHYTNELKSLGKIISSLLSG